MPAAVPISSLSPTTYFVNQTTRRSSPFVWHGASYYIFITFYSFMIIAIVLSNACVVILFARMARKMKKKIPNILLFNQSLVDVFVGLTSISKVLMSAISSSREENSVAFFFIEYTTFLALGVLLVGTAERFVSVKYPFVHRHKVTLGRVLIVLACTWAVTLIPGLVHATVIFARHDQAINDRYYIVAYCVLLFILIVIFGFLGSTYREIQSSITKRQDTSAATSERVQLDQKAQKKVNRVFLLMSLLYTVTIAPHIIGSVIIDAMDVPKTSVNFGKTAFHLFYISSSLLNPVITVMGKPDYKGELLKALGRGSKDDSPTSTTVTVMGS